MATLELSRDPTVFSQEQVRREETPGLLNGSIEASLFPVVPTHMPRSRITRQYDAEDVTGRVMPIRALNGDVQLMKWSETNIAYPPQEEEEMEEVLEELQDDEMEEMADSTGFFSPDSTMELIGQEYDTLHLLGSAQAACITSIQSLLRTIATNTSQIHTLGGTELVESFTKLSEIAATSGNIFSDPSVHTPFESLHLIEPLITTLQQVPLQIPATEGDLTDETKLLILLRDLAIAIQATRDTTELLDSRCFHSEGNEVVSPSTSQASSNSPKDVPFTQSLQQNRGQRVQSMSRQGAVSSLLISSGPLMSREELRNPFSDDGSRSQSVALDDRLRNRSDREMEILSLMIKALRRLDKRSSEVVASLETISPSESNTDAEQQNNEMMLEKWSNLQELSKITQQSLASRQSLLLNLDIKKESYSPTYSPSRGRSRRNSNISLQSASTSLHNLDAGDPVGEATAAGVGAGITRSLSGLSSLSGTASSSSAIGVLPPTSSYLPASSAHIRRESTRSDRTAGGRSAKSAPPRYSEESARKWTENVLCASREAESSGQERERKGSGGNLSDFSAKQLPAYNSTDLLYQKMSSSTSSLDKLDILSKNEKKSSIDSTSTRQPLQSSTSAEYSARTSQDLRMVESSIERLYSAIPQLDNQRASSPIEIKQRQSQDVLLLVEQLTKSGRMEDQRAVLSSETLQRIASVASSPDIHSDTVINPPISANTLSNTRIGKRLGSISFGRNLSIRLASSVLGTDIKGKEKEKCGDTLEHTPTSSPRVGTFDDLVPLANQVQAASERGYKDQRAEIRAKPGSRKKPSKLDLMGNTIKRTDANQDDGGFLDALATSMSSSRRMADQDAPLRPFSAKRILSTPSSATASTFSSSPITTAPSRLADTCPRSAANLPNSPIRKTMDGESIGSLLPLSGSNADSSDRGVCIDNGVESSQEWDQITSLCYISETQPRLESISAQLWERSNGSRYASAEPLDHQIDEDNSQLLNITYRHSKSSYILPSRAMANQDVLSMARLQDHWQIKLQMAASIQRDPQEASNPLSATTLQKDLPIAFVCNVCLKLVAETETITQYLPLPSQHWEELIDAWMCHSDQEIHQGMIDTQRKLHEHRGLQRSQGRVSDAGIVLHASHLLNDASFKGEIDTVQQRLRCTHCQSTLGQEASSGAIELFKYAIRPKMANQSLPPSQLGMIVAHDLIQLSQAHATRHFLLQDNECDLKTYLHLWLFLESFQVAVSLPASFNICGMGKTHQQDTSASLSACKIMYRLPSSTDSLTRPAWAQPDLVEHIQYPKEVCLQLIELLHGSTLSYPTSRRQFASDWTTGFLQTSSSITMM